MRIQNISYSPKAFLPVYNQKKQIEPKAAVNISKPIAFRGARNEESSLDKRSFITIGGSCKFGNAGMLSLPYTGTLTSDFDGITTESFYKNGRKELIKVHKQGCNLPDNGVLYKRYREEKLPENMLNIYYRNAAGDQEYVENYDGYGHLCQTEITQWDKDGKPTCFSRTTYDVDGITVLGSETNISGNYVYQAGYSKKKVECADGRIARIMYDDYIGKNHVSKKCTIIHNAKGNPVRKEEDDLWFVNSEDDEYYSSKASRRRTLYKNGNVTDYDFQTIDYKKGYNPIKKFVYAEHDNTIRAFRDGNIIYYDGLTNDPYAAEIFEDNKELPSQIVNFKDKVYAQKKELATNVVSYDFLYGDNERRIASMLFKRINKQYIPVQRDEYDVMGRRTSITRYYGDDKAIVSHYIGRVNMDRKEEYAYGILRTVNEYSQKKLVKQTQYMQDGSKSVIELHGNRAEEKRYELNSDIPYCEIYYKDGIATKQVIYEEESGIITMKDYSEEGHIDARTGETAPELFLRKLEA